MLLYIDFSIGHTANHSGFSYYTFFSSGIVLYKNGHYWYSLRVRLSVQVLFKTIGFFHLS